jgi:hypothetical protein
MPKFTTNTISINYNVYGTGIPVLLLHGALVDFNYNYSQTGWIKSLSKNGFQVIELIFVVMVKVTKAMIQILRHDKLSK